MTFEQLKFGPRGILSGIQSVVFFPNGYGASIVKGSGTYGEKEGLYELAVLIGDGSNWSLCYDTHITNDVVGYCTPEKITSLLHLIENLEATNETNKLI